MKFTTYLENVALSFRSIAAAKGRSFLTALGVMIGVAAVIGLVALGTGARISVENQLGSLGANLMIVYSGEPRGTSLVRPRTSNITPTLGRADLDFIESFPPDWIVASAPENSANGQLKFQNLNTAATVIGTGPDYPEIRNFQPIYGSFFTAADVESRKNSVVLGIQVYRDLFPGGGDPLGQRVRINGVPFQVTGIMEEKGSAAQDGSVFIPISSFQRSISGGDKYTVINIKAASDERMDELQQMLEEELLRLHRLPSMDAADFYIANQLDIISAVRGVADTFTLLLGGIAAISLLVGGIGIMNIMLVSVTERTREIGVRMAMGAKSKDIMVQFLTEAVLLSSAGGIIGIILGFLVAWAARYFGNLAAVITVDSIVMAFSFALVTGLFFGGYPAWRASRLDPIDALRYE
jgi:putative ABC transport system permease protein